MPSLHNFTFQTCSRGSSLEDADRTLSCWRPLWNQTCDSWKKQDSFINRWLTYKLKISYMSPCPHRLLPLQPVGRRICRWLLWSSRCSPAPWWCGGVACGRGGPHWGLPRQQPSGGSLESWTSLSPVTVPRPLWRNLMGGYRGLYWRNVVGPDKIPINTTSQYCTL